MVKKSSSKTPKKATKKVSVSSVSSEESSDDTPKNKSNTQLKKIIKTDKVPSKTNDKTNDKKKVSSKNSSDSSDSSSQSKKEEKPIKKRGRPRKNTVQKPIIHFDKKKTVQDEEIILHLPLYDEDDNSSDKNLFTAIENSDKQTMKSIVSLSDEGSSEGNHSFNKKELLNELMKRNAEIKKLKSTIADMKINTYESGVYTSKDVKSRALNLNLINFVDNTPIVIEKTDIACWWCTEKFDTIPCFIPDRYLNDKYYVFGCFCAFGCAKAYNSNMNDSRVALRASLINKLSSELFGTSNIQMAPQRELLVKFGGPLTIEEFRDNLMLCKKEHRMSLPPMIPLVPMVEEITKDSSTNKFQIKQKNKYN